MPACCLPCVVEENFTILFQCAHLLDLHNTMTDRPDKLNKVLPVSTF